MDTLGSAAGERQDAILGGPACNRRGGQSHAALSVDDHVAHVSNHLSQKQRHRSRYCDAITIVSASWTNCRVGRRYGHAVSAVGDAVQRDNSPRFGIVI